MAMTELWRWLIWKFVLRFPSFRVLLTKLLIRNENRYVELFGAPVFVNHRQEIGYWNAAENMQANIVFRDEAPVLINLAFLISSGDTILDIGANVGLFSSVLARFPGDVRIMAFEANPDTAKRLEMTLRGRNATVLPIALSDAERDMEFYLGAVSGAFGTASRASAFQRAQTRMVVHARRLDSLDIPGNSIVMKIDVEGHEKQVLEGAAGLFEAKRVKAVFLDGYGDIDALHFLRRHGMTLLDGQQLVPISDVNPPRQIFAVRSQAMLRERVPVESTLQEGTRE